MGDRTTTSVETETATETKRIAARLGGEARMTRRRRRHTQAHPADRCQWTRGPALRTASLTPSAYLAKFSWNISASLRAAPS